MSRSARGADARRGRAPKERRQPRRDTRNLRIRLRLGFPYFCIVAVAVALCGRVLWVGVFNSDTYAELGRDKRSRLITLHEPRGTIFDRNGEALVMSVPSQVVAVDPTLVTEPDATATRIAEILGADRVAVLDALLKPDTQYSVIQRQVDVAVADQLRAAEIPGLTFGEDPRRVALNGELARSVVGSTDRFVTEARSGIERLYDDHLRAVDGQERIERGIGGRTIPGSERVIRPPRAGSNVTLTIDRSLQFVAEAALLRQVEAVGAKGGTVVLGRPQTGEILAMASVSRAPDNTPVQGSLNQAVRSYEPGSVMKIVTVAAAYDRGLVTPQTPLLVEDEITLYDKTIHDSHDHAPETMSVNRILSESSNVGTIKVAQMLEQDIRKQGIVDYLHSFGFGSYTAVGFPREQAGIVKDPKDWYGTDIGSIPIGQSVTVTPLQMWSAYNTVANDGLYVAPRLVRDIVDAEGRHHPPRVPKPRRVISVAAANMVTRGLEDVVEEGTGKRFAIPGFSIAAKTGTAYKVQDNGTYGRAGNRKYMSSFVGFFPASSPEISIMVMIDEPAFGQHFGATAAGPVFDELAKESMRRFSIAGDAAPTTPRAELIRAEAAVAPTTTTTTVPVAVDPATGQPVAVDPATAAPAAAAAAGGAGGAPDA